LKASIFAVAEKFEQSAYGMLGDGEAHPIYSERDVMDYHYLMADIRLGDVDITLEQKDGVLTGFWENSVSGDSGDLSISNYENGDAIDYLQYVVKGY